MKKFKEIINKITNKKLKLHIENNGDNFLSKFNNSLLDITLCSVWGFLSLSVISRMFISGFNLFESTLALLYTTWFGLSSYVIQKNKNKKNKVKKAIIDESIDISTIDLEIYNVLMNKEMLNKEEISEYLTEIKNLGLTEEEINYNLKKTMGEVDILEVGNLFFVVSLYKNIEKFIEIKNNDKLNNIVKLQMIDEEAKSEIDYDAIISRKLKYEKEKSKFHAEML